MIRYRNEAVYNSGERDIVNVMAYEVYDLGNTDILDYCLTNHTKALSDELRQKIAIIVATCEICDSCTTEILGCLKHYENDISDELLQKMADIDEEKAMDDFDEEEIIQLCRDIVDSINSYYGKSYKYCLWLADMDSVKEYYNSEEPEINGYETSECILSELGYSGTLYAYEEMPLPVTTA